MEETIRLKCVTRGNLIIPRGKFNAESDKIQFSLTVKDPFWQPRVRVAEWDSDTRTFTMVSHFAGIFHHHNVLGLEE